MFRYIRFSVLVFLIVYDSPTGEAQLATNEADIDAKSIDMAKALHPELYCMKYGDDWEIYLQFTPVAEFKRNTWMLTPNPFGAQIQICLTNGVQCQPKNQKVLDAYNLPFFTTVSNALKGTDPTRRSLQWPDGNTTFQPAGFRLKSAFAMSFTNDVFLQVTPLMYKENTNNQLVWLVNFTPIRIKLKADGTVEKLE